MNVETPRVENGKASQYYGIRYGASDSFATLHPSMRRTVLCLKGRSFVLRSRNEDKNRVCK